VDLRICLWKTTFGLAKVFVGEGNFSDAKDSHVLVTESVSESSNHDPESINPSSVEFKRAQRYPPTPQEPNDDRASKVSVRAHQRLRSCQRSMSDGGYWTVMTWKQIYQSSDLIH